MNHAETYYIGYYQTAPAKIQATAVAQTVRRVRRVDSAAKGRRRDTERQMEGCTNSYATDGLLKCSFLPKILETQAVQDCKNAVKVEKDFYQSLSQLTGHYDISPMETKYLGRPYNIALALYDTQEKLKGKVRDWEGIRLIQDDREPTLRVRSVTTLAQPSTTSLLYHCTDC